MAATIRSSHTIDFHEAQALDIQIGDLIVRGFNNARADVVTAVEAIDFTYPIMRVTFAGKSHDVDPGHVYNVAN